MNNPLFDLVGRQLLLRMGFTPQQIEASLKAMRVQKSAPKPPPAGSITPKGQTNLFTQSGKVRNFTKPNPLAPTLSPVANVNRAVLQPGPVRPPAPGQMELFGTNPTAKPSGRFTAPRVPAPGSGTIKASKDAMQWLQQQVSGNAAVNRALRFDRLGKALSPQGGGGAAVATLQLANILQDIYLQKFDPETYLVKKANENMYGAGPTREEVLMNRNKLGTGESYGPPAELNVPPAAATSQVTAAAQPVSRRQPAVPRATAARVAPAAAARPPVEQAYGASGKDLYMSHKKNNPLMIRYFGKNYGSSKKA
jgi:hypothetical protein